jgi:hypothetical protein
MTPKAECTRNTARSCKSAKTLHTSSTLSNPSYSVISYSKPSGTRATSNMQPPPVFQVEESEDSLTVRWEKVRNVDVASFELLLQPKEPPKTGPQMNYQVSLPASTMTHQIQRSVVGPPNDLIVRLWWRSTNGSVSSEAVKTVWKVKT